MLSPMLVQYLVGLCCLNRNPEAVDITLGDMVLDVAANSERDVDVTITLNEAPGVVRAFTAYEVKRETSPLDSPIVEQLCAKLRDMPSVTDCAIVSASGFTKGATNKAKYHGVDLYTIKPSPYSFEEIFSEGANTAPPMRIAKTGRILLKWVQRKSWLDVSSGPQSFSINPSDEILSARGAPHRKYPSFDALENAMLLRSTEILMRLEPANTMLQALLGKPLGTYSPEWQYAHTLDVTSDKAFLKFDGTLASIDSITFNGNLQWQGELVAPVAYVMQRVSDGEIFAGASVLEGESEGEMYCLVASPNSKAIGVHPVRLAEKHRNVIRRLKLFNPTGQPK